MQDLLTERDDYARAMQDQLARAKESGCQYARNERDYRVALARAILEERDRGTPVTIIGDICRGREDVAALKLARDCSEAVYKADAEAVNVYKLRARIVEQQIQREWHSGGVSGEYQ